jgi:NDP-sugar pyrophosphorylase family protein
MVFAVIAAGDGSRLKAEGISVSKPLVNLQGVPMIERLLELAIVNGASRFCCIINEQASDLKAYFREKVLPIPCQVIVRSTPSSMHSLFALAPLLKESPFCVTTADAVFRADEFQSFVAHARARKDTDGILAVTEYIDDERPLCVEMDSESRILAFHDSKAGLQWATGGVYYFAPSIFNVMDQALEDGVSRLRNFLRHLLVSGYRLHGYPFSKIIDVDHIRDVEAAERFLQEQASRPT